jgi:hypothetical protein
MEIYNGGRLTVRYFAGSLSPGEASALRELERATNEANYVANLQDLKSQYATDAQLLEAQRLIVQQQLNGVTLTTSTGFYGYGSLRDIYDLAGLRFPALATYPYGYAGGFGYGYGGLGYGFGGYGVGSGALTRALAANIIDEGGPVKNALAAVVARDGTSANAVAVERALDRAVVTAAGSPAIRKQMGLPDRRDAYIAPVAHEETAPVVVTLKNGRRILGTKLEETKEWITVSSKGGKSRVRPDEVAEIQEGGGVGPAAGKE